MLAYICTIPSVKSRNEDETNLKWLQQIIDDNVKKKMAIETLYKPSVKSNKVNPEILNHKNEDGVPYHSNSNAFHPLDAKLKSSLTNNGTPRAGTDRSLSDKITLKEKLKNFDLPLDIFAQATSTPLSSTSSAWESFQEKWKALAHAAKKSQVRENSFQIFKNTFETTTTTTTQPIARQVLQHRTMPIFASSLFPKSFSNGLSDSDKANTTLDKRTQDERSRNMSNQVSVLGHDEKTILPSPINKGNVLISSPNNLLSSNGVEKLIKSSNIPVKSDSNAFNVPNNQISSQDEPSFFDKPNNIFKDNKDFPEVAQHQDPIYIPSQTDQNIITNVPSKKSAFRLPTEGVINQIEKDHMFSSNINTPTNGMSDQITNKVTQINQISGNYETLRDHALSLIEKSKLADETHESDQPISSIIKPVSLTDKTADINPYKPGPSEDRSVQDKATDVQLSMPGKPAEDVAEINTNGLVDNLSKVGNIRIKICKSYTVKKPKYDSCLRLQTLTAPVQLCTHPLEQDYKVSGSLHQSASWEFPMMTDLLLAMLKTPGIGLIDIGAGVGAYSIAAAAHGHPVIAVEPYMPHIRLLQQSIVLNGLQKYISVVCNAISDYEEILQAKPVPGHLTDVVWNYVPETDFKTMSSKSENFVQTITLDDLVEVINLTTAILKLDAPNYDFKILKKAHMLFDKVDIMYVFMHWAGKTEQDFHGIADFFVKQNYRALEKYHGKEIDPDALIQSGRPFVVWEKRKLQ